MKGGDFRSREANVYRLAETSVKIIDQCVAQGVPFAREYGGLLDNRSFGGAQVSRTFYARGQTGQQLLLGAYQALERQIGLGKVQMFPRHEMLDVILVDGRARGIVTRDMVTGKVESWLADAVCLATGGYGNVFYLATYAKGCNATAIWRAYKKGAAFGNPCYTQIHPTCIPVTGDHQSKLTLMSESLRNDGRIWVPKKKGDTRPPGQIPESERDYYLERKYPSFGNLVPRDVASRNAKQVCDDGRGVGTGGYGVYLDFADAIARLGKDAIEEKYGNLFEMYERITDEDPYKVPMRIYPASHYTMGGLWVDYNLMSTIPGLHVLGEANFSDHGANRLGASALMQGLADGYFVIPYTIGHYIASSKLDPVASDHPEVKRAEAGVAERTKRLMGIGGKRTSTSFHRELGRIMWEHCGMARNRKGLETALQKIPALREEFWRDVKLLGDDKELNQSLSTRAVWPTSSSSPSSCAWTPSSAKSRAAATSARSTRRRTGRRCATTRSSPMWPPGSTRAMGRSPCATRRPSRSRTSTSPAELQVMKVTLHVWRQKNARAKGRFVTYEPKDVSPETLVPRDARTSNDRPDPEGRRPHRLRPRLPRGDLRHVRHDDQRLRPTVRARRPRPASSTCAISRTATRSPSSRGARARSR